MAAPNRDLFSPIPLRRQNNTGRDDPIIENLNNLNISPIRPRHIDFNRDTENVSPFQLPRAELNDIADTSFERFMNAHAHPSGTEEDPITINTSTFDTTRSDLSSDEEEYDGDDETAPSINVGEVNEEIDEIFVNLMTVSEAVIGLRPMVLGQWPTRSARAFYVQREVRGIIHDLHCTINRLGNIVEGMPETLPYEDLENEFNPREFTERVIFDVQLPSP